MTTDFLSFLRPDTAENYSVSIRLRVDGLCFIVFSEDETRQYEEFFGYPNGVLDEKEAVEEIFYRNPFLAYPYKKVRILYEPLAYTLVPQQLYDESKGSYWLQAISEEPEVGAEATARQWECYTTDLNDGMKLLLSAANKPVLRFLNRQMLVTEPRPYFESKLFEEAKVARESSGRQMSVLVRRDALDVFLFTNGEVTFANKFDLSVHLSDADAKGEIVYYILMLCRNHKIDSQRDGIRICVDDERFKNLCSEVASLISSFVSHSVTDIL